MFFSEDEMTGQMPGYDFPHHFLGPAIRVRHLRTIRLPIHRATPEARHDLGFCGISQSERELKDFVVLHFNSVSSLRWRSRGALGEYLSIRERDRNKLTGRLTGAQRMDDDSDFIARFDGG